jgi:hypothetical protein
MKNWFHRTGSRSATDLSEARAFHAGSGASTGGFTFFVKPTQVRCNTEVKAKREAYQDDSDHISERQLSHDS